MQLDCGMVIGHPEEVMEVEPQKYSWNAIIKNNFICFIEVIYI